MNKNYDFLIIGSSAAGLAALRILKSMQPQARIGMITKFLPAYNTCKLVDYVQDRALPESFLLYDIAQAKKDGIEVIIDTVISIDSEKQEIETQQGHYVGYKKLLIAVGTLAKLPPLPHCFGYHTFADAQKIKEHIEKSQVKRIVIIGGGLNGLECASALAARGQEVVVVEQERILREWPEPVARWIKEHLEKNGIRVLEQTTVVDYADSLLRLSSQELSVDLVISTIGCTSAFEKIDAPTLKTRNGYIVVDAHRKTNCKNIWAAGDCTISDYSEQRHRWIDAVQQAIQVAYNMQDIHKPNKPMPALTQTELCGMQIDSYGVVKHAFWRSIIKHDILSCEYYLYDNEEQLRGVIIAGNKSRFLSARKQIV